MRARMTEPEAHCVKASKREKYFGKVINRPYYDIKVLVDKFEVPVFESEDLNFKKQVFIKIVTSTSYL